ncbi:MAG: DUF924 domain-containing protein [Candidatus Omnitrophica bacterium]|nr:DUF924 domain-containing protein [Candidatus Omnitrophota bacterium]
MERVAAILDFWFDGITEETILTDALPVKTKWFSKSEAVDQEIRDKFNSDLIKARKGKYSSWMDSSVGALALIILLDQMPRNIYRGSEKAFDTDLQALECSLLAVKNAYDQELSLIQRQFLYMPMMHSENLMIQKKSLKYFKDLVDVAQSEDPKNFEYFNSVYDFAKLHQDIILKFERFPHRNAALKRRSTSTEMEFLKSSASSF